ncbi:MAG TPA: hypothetical protein VGL65_00415 [Gemmatimonadales bacterium]|jgi:hypothetical protein
MIGTLFLWLSLHEIVGGLVAVAAAFVLMMISVCALLGTAFAALWIRRLVRNAPEFVGREIPRSTSVRFANAEMDFVRDMAVQSREMETFMKQTAEKLAKLQQQVDAIRGYR